MTEFPMRSALAAVLMVLAAVPASAQGYIVLDGNRNAQTMRALNTGTGFLQQTSPSDPTGNPFSQSNPQYFNMLLNGAQLGIGQNNKASSLPVAPPSDPDVRPNAGTISAADAISVTVGGQNSQSIITGAPTANSYVTQAVNGVSNVMIQITGVWVGSINFEESIDGGITWVYNRCRLRGNAQISPMTRTVTGNGLVSCEAAGATNMRARASAWTSGTAVVTMTLSAFPGTLSIQSALQIFPNNVTSVDQSGTIATGGSYQTAIAAPTSTPIRQGCLIQNPTTATEVLNVKFGSMAQPFTLLPGSSIGCTIGDSVLQDTITVMAATLGHAYAATSQ
jgi:hypothetical protein